MSDDLSRVKRLLMEIGPDLKQGHVEDALQTLASALHILSSTPISKAEHEGVSLLLEKVVARFNMHQELRELGVAALDYRRGQEESLSRQIEKLNHEVFVARREQMRATLERETEKMEALYARGMEQLHRGEPKRALLSFQRLTSEYDCPTQLLQDIARLLQDKGDHLHAVDFLELAAAKDPDNAEINTMTALAFQRLRQLDKAERYFLQSLRTSADEATHFFNIATFYFESRNWEKAHQAALETLQRRPEHQQARVLLDRIEKKIYLVDDSSVEEAEVDPRFDLRFQGGGVKISFWSRIKRLFGGETSQGG